MSGGTSLQKDRNLIAVIGDEDSVTGLLLAGIGHTNQQQKKNFLVVDASKICKRDNCGIFLERSCNVLIFIIETALATIESAFQNSLVEKTLLLF
ncbi:unnamed protein product [Umbelopsis ramanniana]